MNVKIIKLRGHIVILNLKSKKKSTVLCQDFLEFLRIVASRNTSLSRVFFLSIILGQELWQNSILC
jgi:hypothetical protein